MFLIGFTEPEKQVYAAINTVAAFSSAGVNHWKGTPVSASRKCINESYAYTSQNTHYAVIRKNLAGVN